LGGKGTIPLLKKYWPAKRKRNCHGEKVSSERPGGVESVTKLRFYSRKRRGILRGKEGGGTEESSIPLGGENREDQKKMNIDL